MMSISWLSGSPCTLRTSACSSQFNSTYCHHTTRCWLLTKVAQYSISDFLNTGPLMGT